MAGSAGAPAAPITGTRPCRLTALFSDGREEKKHVTSLFTRHRLNVSCVLISLTLSVSCLPLKHPYGSGPGTDVWLGPRRMSPTHLSTPDRGGSHTDRTGCRTHGRPWSWERRYQSLQLTANKERKAYKDLLKGLQVKK